MIFSLTHRSSLFSCDFEFHFVLVNAMIFISLAMQNSIHTDIQSISVFLFLAPFFLSTNFELTKIEKRKCVCRNSSDQKNRQ